MLELDELLIKVLDRGGSDLHLTVGMPPVVRLHGKLIALEGRLMTPADTRRVVHSVMEDNQRELLEETRECDFAYSVPGRARFRVNAYYQRGSIAAAFRLIPTEIKSFEELGLPDVLQELSLRPRGFVLVTGPTGSGKSTTQAAIIDYINHTQSVHIMTIEDPVEYLHRHDRSMINQREVGADTESFSEALRRVLRQDPDVILIGEMRDLETVQAALTAAETGHLVFATLHTQDAVRTIDRIVDVFPSHQQNQVRSQLAATLEGIISQQLVPTIDGRNRVIAAEVLLATPAIRSLIREGKTHQLPAALQTGHKHGMRTMDESLAELCKRGLITLDTALSRAIDTTVVRTLLR